MATQNVGTIVYDAVIDTKGIKKGAAEADEAAKDTGKSLEKNISRGAVIAGAAMVATGATFMKVSKDSLQSTTAWAGGIVKLARETGGTTEAISKLVYAGQRFGLEADEMSRSLGLFSRKLVEAKTDTSKAAETFKALGINVKDSKGQLVPFDTIFGQVAEKFKTMPNGVEKTALAMELFGRSGKDMLPLLNQGAKGMADLGQQAEKFGLVLSGQNVAAFAKFRKASFEGEQAAKGLQVQLGLLTLGPVTKLKERTTELTESLNNLPQPIKDITGNLIVFGGPALTAAGSVLTLAGSIGGLTDAFPKLGLAIRGALGPVGLIMLGVTAAVLAAYVVWKNWETISAKLEPILRPLSSILIQLKDNFAALAAQLRDDLAPAITWVSNNWSWLSKVMVALIGVALIPVLVPLAMIVAGLKVLAVTIGWVAQNFDTFKNIVLGVMGALFGGIGNHVRNIISLVSNIGPSIVRSVGGFGNLLYDRGRDLIQGLINGANSILPRIGQLMASRLPSALQGPFKKALGISSPSKVFAGYGKNIIQGLSNGVTDNIGMISSTMGKLSSAASYGLQSPTINGIDDIGSGYTVGNSSSATISLNVSGIFSRSKSDERDVARSLLRSINEELKAKGQTPLGEGAI